VSHVLCTLELIEGEYNDLISHKDMESEGFKFVKKQGAVMGATNVAYVYKHPNYPEHEFFKGVGSQGLVMKHKFRGFQGVVKTPGDVHSFLSDYYQGR